MTGYKHGHARPENRNPAYRSWECARSRCRNPRNPDYHDYGGRGITFCSKWDDFTAFLADMGARPKGMTLDRIKTDGHYEPGNCRWASDAIQQRNKRSNQRVTYCGDTLTIADLSRETGVPYQRLHERIIRRGWDVERAVHEEPRRW